MPHIVLLTVFLLVFSFFGNFANSLKCALIQFSEKYEDEVNNDAGRLENYIREAAKNGAKLIVSPENCLYRYAPWSRNNVTELDLANYFNAIVKKFSTLASELKVNLVIGTREPTGTTPPTYQSAVFIDYNGYKLKTYRKRVPSSAEYSYTKSGGHDWVEHVFFKDLTNTFPSKASFQTPIGRVFMQICKDMDDKTYVNYMPTDIKLLIGLSKDPTRGYVKVQPGCQKARVWGIGVNYAGNSVDVGGNSGFVDPTGKVVKQAGSGSHGANQGILYQDIPI